MSDASPAIDYGAARVPDAPLDARDVADAPLDARRSKTVVTPASTRAVGAFAFAFACAVAVKHRVNALRASRFVDVRFAVDVGCIRKTVMENAPVENFWEYDLTGVDVVLRGNDPECEFGGVTRKCHALPLAQEGFSTVYRGTHSVPEETEYGFVLKNSAGQNLFELGHNKRFPERGELANEACLIMNQAGGGHYRNRRLPKTSTMVMVNGAYDVKYTWAGCREQCPLTVKLIATVGPESGIEDNVYGIEESKAREEPWRKYKGHMTSVSAGEFNTWSLNSQTGKLYMSRNADLNPYSAANWNEKSNNLKVPEDVAQGSVVDFDAGYSKVYAVTKTVDRYGGHTWQRNVDGSGEWEPAGAYSGSRLIQVTIGRTHLWGVNGINQLWRCRDPCLPHSSWTDEGFNVKQLEVGDAVVFAVHTDNRQLKTKGEDGTGSWSNVPLPAGLATINQVCVGATSLWILDFSGDLWSCDLPCAGGNAITRVSSAPKDIITIDAGKVPHTLTD